MTDETIEDLAAGFEATTLPKEAWTHTAHLVVALRYVRLFGAEEAASRMRDGLQRFNAAKGGSASAYHETLTLAWIAVLARFLADEDRGQPLGALGRAAAERFGDKHYLDRFYSHEVLMSDEARSRWVSPDRRSLDDGSEEATGAA